MKRFVSLLCVLAVSGCGYFAEPEPMAPSAQDNVLVVDEPLIISGLDRPRQIRLYLPPGYDQSDKRYPVLYMHDAQNLFDDATSFVGEWHVDETLNRLASEAGLELIVVGIDNGQEKRMNELSPWPNERFGVAEGEQYMQFIVKQVKPYIDSEYRTLSDRDNTAIMGSSMGGLISHFAIFAHGDIFSRAGIFSPSYWYSEEVYRYSAEQPLAADARLFFLMGEKEGDNMVVNMQRMVEQIKQQGHDARLMSSKVTPDAEHNETFWSSEFGDAIVWLMED